MRISFKRFVLVGGIAFALFVAYMAYQLLTPTGPIAVSPRTTVITEPLADDGLPDFAAYLLGEMKGGVTPENNGAIPFLQAMWPAGLTSRRAVCDELGMEMPTSNGLVDPYEDQDLVEALVLWVRDSQDVSGEESQIEEYATDFIFHAHEHPWHKNEIPALDRWLNDHQQQIDLLQEAARRERYYLPSETLLTDPKMSLVYTLAPHIQTQRSAVRIVAMRANHHIGAGELGAAWEDCRTIHALADTCAGQLVIGEFVSIACEQYGHQVATQILNSDRLSGDLARQIHHFYSQRPFRSMATVFDNCERLSFVTAVLELAGSRRSNKPVAGGPGATSGVLFDSLRSLAMDWELVLIIGNAWYDEIVAAMELPTHAEQQAAFVAIETRMAQKSKLSPGKLLGSALSRTSRSKNVANVLSSLMLPSVRAAKDAVDRANTLLQMQQVAAALAVYRIEHGDYPDDLVPELMESAQLDPYDKPLAYQKTKRGYLLYSFGKNGKDDGGSNESLTAYQGYELGATEAEGRALRELLAESQTEDEVDKAIDKFLRAPKDADDWSLRLPLLRRPLPEFQPADAGDF